MDRERATLASSVRANNEQTDVIDVTIQQLRADNEQLSAQVRRAANRQQAVAQELAGYWGTSEEQGHGRMSKGRVKLQGTRTGHHWWLQR